MGKEVCRVGAELGWVVWRDSVPHLRLQHHLGLHPIFHSRFRGSSWGVGGGCTWALGSLCGRGAMMLHELKALYVWLSCTMTQIGKPGILGAVLKALFQPLG